MSEVHPAPTVEVVRLHDKGAPDRMWVECNRGRTYIAAVECATSPAALRYQLPDSDEWAHVPSGGVVAVNHKDKTGKDWTFHYAIIDGKVRDIHLYGACECHPLPGIARLWPTSSLH